jgi:hypothetical protein
MAETAFRCIKPHCPADCDTCNHAVRIKERPILFSGPMIRALLDGTKTQTRRVVKPLGADHVFQFRGTTAAAGADEPTGNWGWCGSPGLVNKHIKCPYGKPGERLWVRETFYCDHAFYPDGVSVDSMWREVDGNRVPIPLEEQRADMLEMMFYRADGEPEFEGAEGPTPWRPSIHMPRWASRILLEITEVRVERLQDISEADAGAEGVLGWDYKRSGVPRWDEPRSTNRDEFRKLWQSINGPSAWDANPWVWAISFRRLKP